MTDDKIQISLSNNIIYTFKPEQGNNDNNKIRFFMAQEDNKNVKSNFFNSKIMISYRVKRTNNEKKQAIEAQEKQLFNEKNVGKYYLIDMCKKIDRSESCNSAKTGRFSSTTNSLLSRKLNRNINTLTVNYLKNKILKLVNIDGIAENQKKKMNAMKKNVSVPLASTEEIELLPNPGNLNGGGTKLAEAVFGLTLVSIILCASGIPIGCTITIIIAMTLFIYLLVTNPSIFAIWLIFSGGSKRKMKGGDDKMSRWEITKQTAKVTSSLMKVLWSYKNFAFYEIGKIEEIPQQKVSETDKSKFKALVERFGLEFNPTQYKIVSPDPEARYFMAVEFVSTERTNNKTTAMKSFGKTKIRIPYIVRIPNTLYKSMEIDNNNFFAKINYINQTALPFIPMGKLTNIENQIKQLNEAPEGQVPATAVPVKSV